MPDNMVTAEYLAGQETFDRPAFFGNLYGFSIIGDSRAQDVTVGTNKSGMSGKNWFTWARAFFKGAVFLVDNYGVSGYRSDQYLTNGNLEKAATDFAHTIVFAYPAVNDISQAVAGNYVDKFGRTVTTANVADLAVYNIISAAQALVSNGKFVVLFTEPGATTLNATGAAIVHEFNRKLRQAVRNTHAVFLYDPTNIIWNPTGSTTLISKKTNFSLDGTHAALLEGYTVGKDFATNFLTQFLPKIDMGPVSLSDTIANGTNQIYRNPLFNVTTGGTAGGNCTITNSVPDHITISGSGAIGATVTVNPTANANGYGNDIQFVCAATSAGDIRIDLNIDNADWDIAGIYEAQVEMDVAAGSTAATYQLDLIQITNSGTADMYALAAKGLGVGPTTGDTGMVIKTREVGNNAGTSKTSMAYRILINFTGNGALTFTLRRPAIYRMSV